MALGPTPLLSPAPEIAAWWPGPLPSCPQGRAVLWDYRLPYSQCPAVGPTHAREFPPVGLRQLRGILWGFFMPAYSSQARGMSTRGLPQGTNSAPALQPLPSRPGRPARGT